MFNYLVDHAIKNIWADPRQDNQMILKLARITKHNGDIKKTKVIWQQLFLPDETSRWHVFQIGQVHPVLLGLYFQNNEWISFSQSCEVQNLICDIYTKDGIQIPKFQSFYMNNLEKNLIVAIKEDPKIPVNFRTDDIYLRLYSNAFFQTSATINLNDKIKVKGRVMNSLNDINEFMTEYDYYKSLQGKTDLYINGILFDSVLGNIGLTDIAELIYDASVYKEVSFNLNDVFSFDSLMDFKKKYLLHYSGADDSSIDYQDDIDVHILMDKTLGKYVGLYYHKNNEDSFRNLTHRDYSVCVPYVKHFIDVLSRIKNQNLTINTSFIKIKLSIRKAGYHRDLVFENSRIHELYKMRDADIVKSMIGFDSLVPVWKAENLEKSAYCEIMRSEVCDITPDLVEKALGYNAISKVLGDTPARVFLYSGMKCIDIPPILQKSCTAYEYDVNGEFLNWRAAPAGARYFVTDNNAEYVELISGIGGDILDETYDVLNVGINDNKSYRVYSCKKFQGFPDNIFSDVTGTNKYKIENNRLIWLESSLSTFPVVRFDTKFLCIDKEINIFNGILKLTLTHLQKRNTQIANWIMQIPMGEILVMLNNKTLIRGLDYIYNFPEIIITNKKYLIDPENQTQKIHVRFTGFCKNNFELNEYMDVGFIEHGFLSNNNRFNLRDDKVLRMSVDGKLFLRDQIQFSELTPGVSILNQNNGLPYCIKDIVVPTRSETPTETYMLRDLSVEIDKNVSDLLTLKIPQPPRQAPSAIQQRYPIFSPFICKVLYDLALDTLVLENKIYSVQEIIEIMKSKGYEKLASVDLTLPENEPDSNYVVFHPHALNVTIQLSLNKFRFLQSVVDLYTRGLVVLNPHVQVI